MALNRKHLYQIMEADSDGHRISRIVDFSLVALILINVIALVLESVDEIYTKAPWFFDWIETFSLIIFAAEYFIRIWVAVEASGDTDHPLKARLRYIISFHGILDLLAFAPQLILLLPGDYRGLRAIRLFRLFRLLKLTRYSAALQSFENVMRKQKEDLLSTIMILLVLLLVASSLMFYAEHEVQPEAFSSIPMTMWWGVATLTTVGYGDIYPITAVGKLIGAVVAILGIGLFALPAGIISASYLEELAERRRVERGKGK